jgi:tRNA threonylcarbamoyladenosine biosynthesis protein TsaB
MPTILAADTGTNVNTVALCRVDITPPYPVEILAESTALCGRLHAERLVETVQWVLAQASLTLEAVDCLAVANGPGSFTGVRIGVATWKGLAVGAGKPLLGVSSLDALARQMAPIALGEAITVCPAFDARMGEVFGAAYSYDREGRKQVRPPAACPVETLFGGLEGVVIAGGDGARLYRERIAASCPGVVFAPEWLSTPRAAAIAAEAAEQLRDGMPDATGCDAVDVVYLRKSQAETSRDQRNAGKAGA